MTIPRPSSDEVPWRGRLLLASSRQGWACEGLGQESKATSFQGDASGSLDRALDFADVMLDPRNMC